MSANPKPIRSGHGPGQRCPHCKQPSKVRTSVHFHALYREVTYQCTNVLCGYCWVSGLEVLRTLSPSATPNPEIHVSDSPHIIKANP